jgi:hypothetical protein
MKAIRTDRRLRTLVRTVALVPTLQTCFLALALLLLHSPLRAESAASRDLQIKAAIVYRLARYVAWPETSLREPPASFHLCMLGDGPFAQALRSAESYKVDEHPIRFMPLDQAVGRIGDCHLLYVSGGAWNASRNVLEDLRSQPVLTISDVPGFVYQGGMVGLVKKQKRIAFEININRATDAGLKINAELLDLATVVAEP